MSIARHDVMLAMVDVGTGLWLVVYVLAIVHGFKHKTYGIPLVSVLLNLSWEILAAFVWVSPEPLWHAGAVAWLCLDLVVAWQALRYGRSHQAIPEIRRWFYPILAVGFALSLSGQSLLARFAGDERGFADSYLINLIMSILFIQRYFACRRCDGMTYGIAWAKALGTGIISVALGVDLGHFFPEASQEPLMCFLFVTVFAFDVLYIAILTHARKAQNQLLGGGLAVEPGRAWASLSPGASGCTMPSVKTYESQEPNAATLASIVARAEPR